jgi:hypothetical protein
LQLEKNSQLQSQIAFLLGEKPNNGEQHPRVQGSRNVGCETDAQVVVASTQTEMTSEFGGEILPALTEKQTFIEAESYGFELDYAMIERFSGQNQPFYIPALDDQPKPFVVAPRAPKVDYPCSDIRYPVSGYVVNSDGTTMTYGDAVEATKSPQFDYPCSDIRYRNQPISGYVVNSDGTTMTYGDAVEATKSPQEISSARKTKSEVLPKPHDVKDACAIDYPKVDDLIVTSSSIEQETLGYNKLLLKSLPIEEYGRVVGKGGVNIQRIEKESNVRVSINKPVGDFFSLIISRNSEEMRQAAANDIIGGFKVKTECLLKYVHRISVHKLREIGQKLFVKIQRPSEEENEKVTISGKLTNCKLAYAALVSELKAFH